MLKRTALLMLTLSLVLSTAWAGPGGGGTLQDTVRKGDIAKPELIQKIEPKYPADAREEKVQGVVTLEAMIDTDGNVAEIKSVKEADERLVKAAIHAVKQWKFKPAADRSGKPVKVRTTLTVNFKLK